MQQREDEQKQIAEFIGSGNVPQSLSDQVVEELSRPEIMGIDVSEYATTKEEVVPPEITKFYETKQGSFIGRIATSFVKRFRSIFNR